jgi:hypothetical protein
MYARAYLRDLFILAKYEIYFVQLITLGRLILLYLSHCLSKLTECVKK